MRLYEFEQSSVAGGWLLREPEDGPLVDQVGKLLDVVEREQKVIPDWLQSAFAPFIDSTRWWIDDPATAADHERLREILDRLRAYRVLIGRFAERDR